MEDARLSIYRAARSIKRKENSLYNALRSIYEDSIFVGEIFQLWPDLPLLANLRCGLWYFPRFYSTCYFKSTDGHTNNWSFNISRLNLHVAHLAGQKGGCIIVDSTRKGKRFPDSMSKTIPIWCCVLNRSIFNYLNRMHEKCSTMDGESNAYNQQPVNGRQVPFDWDCSLHLPIWVSETERASIGDRLEEWTQELEASGVDIASLASSLKKPLRPLWVSQKTVIWLNEVPEYNAWDFTPIILVCASTSNGIAQNRISLEFSWNYISGAGDDEESWARGLSPSIFWSNVYDLINSSPDLCNQMVADIVEKDRVYRAQRGQDAPQISVKPSKLQGTSVHLCDDAPVLYSEVPNLRTDVKCSDEDCAISWLGSTNLAVGASQHAANVSNVDCILNCDKGSVSVCLSAEAYMHIPILNSKMDRFCLLNNVPPALKFAKLNLSKGKTLLVCCHNGEDISICVCLAILASLYNEGTFDDGKSFNETCITKLEMRRRLVFICQFATNARPSRGNLKQVFSFLSGGRLGSAS